MRNEANGEASVTHLGKQKPGTRRKFLTGMAGILTVLATGCGGSFRDSLPAVGSRTVNDPFALSGKTIYVEVGSVTGGKAASKDATLTANFTNQSVSNTNLVKNATVKVAFGTQAVVVVPPGATLPQTITLETFGVGGSSSANFELRDLDGTSIARRATLPDMTLTTATPILTRVSGNNYVFSTAPTLQTRLNSSQSRAALDIVTKNQNTNQLAYIPKFAAVSSPTLPVGTRIYLTFGDNSLRVEF